MHFVGKSQFALVHAPAKLNLFLEVHGRRPDGFHEIETLMVAITVFDTLRFAVTNDDQLRLKCRWAWGIESWGQRIVGQRQAVVAEQAGVCHNRSVLGSVPEGHENLVFRALERLRLRAGARYGATIHLVKRIPAAAGLGGASSDVAAALVAANHCWDLRWSQDQLAELGAELGSDVPFFLTGGAAICRGRGEIVSPLEGVGKLDVVVVRPPQGLSTAAVYQNCAVPQRPASVEALIAALRRGRVEVVGRLMMNRLQEPAERLSPWLDRAREVFGRLDCLGHQMSGSGTCYFGVCRNARHARTVAKRLRATGLGLVFGASTFSAPRRL